MRPRKDIPLDDVKGLRTLIDEGKTQQEMADYYNEIFESQGSPVRIDRATISRRIKELNGEENGH